MKHETVENVAGWSAGLAAGTLFAILYVALSAPVAETVLKFGS